MVCLTPTSLSGGKADVVRFDKLSIEEEMEKVTIELRSAEGGDHSKMLIREMVAIYTRACNRRGL